MHIIGRHERDIEQRTELLHKPQAVISGLTEDWRDYLEKNGVYVGSRSALLLPQGGSYGFAQAQANSMVAEAPDRRWMIWTCRMRPSTP